MTLVYRQCDKCHFVFFWSRDKSVIWGGTMRLLLTASNIYRPMVGLQTAWRSRTEQILEGRFVEKLHSFEIISGLHNDIKFLRCDEQRRDSAQLLLCVGTPPIATQIVHHWSARWFHALWRQRLPGTHSIGFVKRWGLMHDCVRRRGRQSNLLGGHGNLLRQLNSCIADQARATEFLICRRQVPPIWVRDGAMFCLNSLVGLSWKFISKHGNSRL